MDIIKISSLLQSGTVLTVITVTLKTLGQILYLKLVKYKKFFGSFNSQRDSTSHVNTKGGGRGSNHWETDIQ